MVDVYRGLGIGLIGLGLGVALNSALGPLVGDVIRYRFSESLIYQGIGLDAVSLVLVAPLCVAAGVLVLRRRAAGPVLGLAPAAYVAYMAVQYVIGPEYLELAGNNERFFPFHLGLFLLGGLTAVRCWNSIDPGVVESMARRRDRAWGNLLLAIAGLLLLRYVPVLVELVGGDPRFAEYRENPTSFLLIATMDLGIVLPVTVATGIGLSRSGTWARKALYGVIGWFALVGAAVAAMAITMLLQGDPNASRGQVVAFGLAAVALVALAVCLYGPLFGVRRQLVESD